VPSTPTRCPWPPTERRDQANGGRPCVGARDADQFQLPAWISGQRWTSRANASRRSGRRTREPTARESGRSASNAAQPRLRRLRPRNHVPSAAASRPVRQNSSPSRTWRESLCAAVESRRVRRPTISASGNNPRRLTRCLIGTDLHGRRPPCLCIPADRHPYLSLATQQRWWGIVRNPAILSREKSTRSTRDGQAGDWPIIFLMPYRDFDVNSLARYLHITPQQVEKLA